MPTVTYVYAARAPVRGLADAADQMSRGHRYRNLLAEIERNRREAAEALLRERCPDLVRADEELALTEAALAEALAQAKRGNSSARARVSATDPVARAQLAEARVRVRTARARQKRLRTALYASGDTATAIRSVLTADVAVAESTEIQPVTVALALRLYAGLDAPERDLCLAALGGAAGLAAIDTQARDRARQARGESGLYWGSYQLVEEAMAEAHKGAPPSFRRWDGRGTTAVHLQGDPVSTAEVLSCQRNDVRFLAAPENTDRPYAAQVWLRVASQAPESRGRPEPVWCVVPISDHRPLPPYGRVRWARLHRRRVGTVITWAIHFVVTLPDEEETTEPDHRPIVAINPGWRRLTDGSLRVCYWVDSQGQEGELRLPAKAVERYHYPSALEGLRDKFMDGVRAVLVAWTRGEPPPVWLEEHIIWLRGQEQARPRDDSRKATKRADYARRTSARQVAAWETLRDTWPTAPPALPDWFRERTESLAQRSSQDRLAGLTIGWQDRPFPGDGPMLAALHAWRHRDKHLCDWAAFQRRDIVRDRTDLYRKFACRLAQEYRTVVAPEINWREILARPEPDEADEYGLRTYARLASPGELVRFIGEKTSLRKISAPELTLRCHGCHERCEWDRAKLENTCEHCGRRWDQDANAARNTLARGLVVDGTTGIARDAEARGDAEVAAEPVRRSRRTRRATASRSRGKGEGAG